MDGYRCKAQPVRQILNQMMTKKPYMYGYTEEKTRENNINNTEEKKPITLSTEARHCISCLLLPNTSREKTQEMYYALGEVYIPQNEPLPLPSSF